MDSSRTIRILLSSNSGIRHAESENLINRTSPHMRKPSNQRPIKTESP